MQNRVQNALSAVPFTIKSLLFNQTAEDIKTLSTNFIAQRKQINDSVASISSPTFTNVLVPLSNADNTDPSGPWTFLKDVCPDKIIRDASADAAQKLEAFEIEQSMRGDLFNILKRCSADPSCASLSGEDKRLLDKSLLSFKRSGLDLDEKLQATLSENKKRLSELGINFAKNIGEDSTHILCTREELKGLDDSFLNELEIVDGKLKVTVQYTDLFPVLKNCVVEETRKRLDVANSSRCKENSPMLEEAVKIRAANAKILGYKNHVAFSLEVKMAKEEKTVLNFLNDLKEKLLPLGQKELERLKELKKSEKQTLGLPYDGTFNSWDYGYYNRMLLESEYQIDHEKIKEYFPMETVTKEMLVLYETVLGLRFRISPETPVWHPDVTAYQVFDAESDKFVGTFYLDLHPRDGKYKHAAVFPLQPGYEDLNGERSYPVAAMVANFAKPTADRPSLLKHDEVVTFYHELGHVMHEICSVTKYARFSGTRTEWDFVEAPSQMLENWCYEASILERLSKHYVTGEKLSEGLCNKIASTRYVNVGLTNLRQLFFALFDITLHGSESHDINNLWEKLRRDVSLIEMIPDSHPWSTFGHIMGGYDSGYYGYLYSQVFSADMFQSRFKEANQIEGGAAGLEYRNLILKPGGSKDGLELLRSFLGREPNAEAFMKSIMKNI